MGCVIVTRSLDRSIACVTYRDCNVCRIVGWISILEGWFRPPRSCLDDPPHLVPVFLVVSAAEAIILAGACVPVVVVVVIMILLMMWTENIVVGKKTRRVLTTVMMKKRLDLKVMATYENMLNMFEMTIDCSILILIQIRKKSGRFFPRFGLLSKWFSKVIEC